MADSGCNVSQSPQGAGGGAGDALHMPAGLLRVGVGVQQMFAPVLAVCVYMLRDTHVRQSRPWLWP